ncbi:CIA30 family protein [Rhodobium gokarnense]|uniref:NADH:ubiquinone oxidoreductase intermediate-associated protein 30 domain-containing protein n=1 Tax=Rhodobium gokarnense TaxID=364296 RepID=A0ABT3H6H7_9HYPH|nr:CIA30 family protein [Rhodobium gokarnense]MCW2305926.1 hypothetical protein [Rhodobium gokarnense]
MRTMLGLFAAALLLAASIGNAIGGEKVIDDFRSNPDQRWRFIADTVMGGVSTGKVAFRTEGGVSFAEMTGEVSTANNGGFIQFRRKVNAPPEGITGVRLVARGNGQRYFVHLRTSGMMMPWQYYQAPFEAGSGWREIPIPLTAFKRSGSLLRKVPWAASIRSVGIVAYGQDHTAKVQVREIGWY